MSLSILRFRSDFMPSNTAAGGILTVASQTIIEAYLMPSYSPQQLDHHVCSLLEETAS
jgi:hypothetical protein